MADDRGKILGGHSLDGPEDGERTVAHGQPVHAGEDAREAIVGGRGRRLPAPRGGDQGPGALGEVSGFHARWKRGFPASERCREPAKAVGDVVHGVLRVPAPTGGD